MKALTIGFILTFMGASQAATNCIVSLTNSETNVLLNRRIHFELANGLSGRGGQELFTYKQTEEENIRLVYGVVLADQVVRFKASKVHTVSGQGTVDEIELCDYDLPGGEGKEQCFDENLALTLNCSQVDEGGDEESFQAVVQRLSSAKFENDRLLKCGVNLDLSFDGVREKLQEKMSGALFKDLKEKNVILVNAQSPRALDMNIVVDKKLLGCNVMLSSANPANNSSAKSVKTKANSCMKALEKALKKVEPCEN